MNALAHQKIRTILIGLCVFVVLAVPGLALAQSGDGVVERFAQGLVWGLVNSVFGFFVWAGGMVLNYAVTNFVTGFGTIYIDGGLGYSVNLLWGIVRDVFNLAFIFGLVFIGFKLILNSGDSSAKRMLGSLIMAALLVNFSLFFTKLIIDFTNIAATQFAAGFINGTTYDVSGSFMALFGLGGLWSSSLSLPALVAGQGWTYIFLSMILFLIAAFVFFAGGILLSIRFVVLNIYMILSPIMFLGWVFPGFSSTSREYWSGFLQRAFFAPAYMLMIYLSNQVLVNYKTTLPPQSMANITTTNPAAAAASFDATIPFFLVASIFLIASLIIAQKMGVQGATTAVALGKRATGKAKQYVGASTFGAAAFAGQRTLGYGANKLANSDKLKSRAANSWLAEKALKASSRVADTSFDARRVGGFGKNAGIGEGKKGGYTSRVTEREKSDADFAKSLGENKIVKKLDGSYADEKIDKRVKADVETARTTAGTELNEAETKLNEAKVAETTAALKATTEGNTLTAEQNAIQAEINRLEQEKSRTILQPKRDELEAEINRAKADAAAKTAQINTLNKEAAEAKKIAEARAKLLTKAESNAKYSAEGRIIYENQLSFIKRRQDDANRWRKLAVPGSLAGAGGTGLIVSGGLVASGAAGAVAGAGLYTKGAIDQASVDNLLKIYGKDGTAKRKQKDKESELKILSAQLKETAEPKEEESK